MFKNLLHNIVYVYML